MGNGKMKQDIKWEIKKKNRVDYIKSRIDPIKIKLGHRNTEGMQYIDLFDAP